LKQLIIMGRIAAYSVIRVSANRTLTGQAVRKLPLEVEACAGAALAVSFQW
jgi:hypothetical protein